MRKWLRGIFIFVAVNVAALSLAFLTGSAEVYGNFIAGGCLGWLIYDYVGERNR